LNVMWTRPSEWDFDTPPWNDSGISGEHFVNYAPATGFTGDADIYHLGTQPPANGGDGLTVREFHDIGGARMADLLVNSKWPNSPDFEGVAAYAEWPQSGDININPPGNVRDNYATHMLGFVHPPETDEYQFFVAADDATVLFLSKDEIPANKQLVAIEPNWNGVREFGQTRNRWIVDIDSVRQINGSAPIRLEAGKAYFIEAITKEGGGGDWMNVMWSRPSEADFDAPPWNDSGISGEHFVNYVPAAGFTGDADVYHLGTQPPASGGGGLTVREFRDIGGARVADLLVHSKWPNSPDFEGVAAYAEWPQSGDINVNPPGNVQDNYAIHMLGFVHPPQRRTGTHLSPAGEQTQAYGSRSCPAHCRGG
jgi:hypothetical protein